MTFVMTFVAHFDLRVWRERAASYAGSGPVATGARRSMCLQRRVRGATIGPEPPNEAASRLSGASREGRRTGMAETAYCMKCREKREFEGQVVTMKNGRPASQGICPVCGTKIQRILGQEEAKSRGWSPS
jgi:hypothetical protein